MINGAIRGLLLRLKRTRRELHLVHQMNFTPRVDEKWKIIRRAAEYAVFPFSLQDHRVLFRPRHDQMGFDYNLLFSFIT